MLDVGVESYISLDEADEIAKKIIENTATMIRWLELPDSEKERKLRNACFRIESLRFSSFKHSMYQALQFPRGMTDVIPDKVRRAQVYEAVATLDEQRSLRRQLQEQGVKSISIGNTSESYTDNPAAAQATETLISKDAYVLLKPYLLGSAVMR